MKLLKPLLAILTIICCFTACQKETSFENGFSVGKLVASATTGECLPIAVSGNYVKDTATKVSNYVQAQINVTTSGTYNISTDTINGMWFNGVGSAAEGLNTIKLYAKGKPTVEDVYTYTIKYGSTNCTFDVVVDGLGGGTTPPATYSFVCNAANIPQGIYYQGVAVGSSNFLPVTVTTTVAGAYTISAVANGVSFSNTGILALGTSTVNLTASGTPSAIGAFALTFTSTSPTSCAVNLITVPAPAAAVYTLNCATATANGTYTAGAALGSSNTITVTANVTIIGAYNITTAPAVNGMTFIGGGIFTSTGAQTITLIGSGTPTASGSSTIPVGTCSVNITVGVASTFTWTYTVGGVTYNGFCSDADNSTYPGEVDISDDGSTTATLNLFYTKVPTATVTASTYSGINNMVDYFDCYMFLSSTNLSATAGVAVGGIFTSTVGGTITTYNQTTHIIQGTFGGNIFSSSALGLVPITGSFKAYLP